MDKSNKLFDERLNQLKNDPNINRNDLRTIIETLITIYKNLVTNKDNEKHRKINTCNTNFNDKVWRHSSAKQLLLSCGWSQTLNDFIIFDSKDIDVSQCLKQLVANREVKPDSKDWINSGQKFFNPNDVKNEELRQMGEKQRLQELEEFEKNKRERQLIAENVKKEIKSDIKFRKSKNQMTQSNESQSNSDQNVSNE